MTTYIGNLDISQPDGQKQRKSVGENVRDTKQAIYNTFSNCTGEVSPTHTVLNYLSANQRGYCWQLGDWESQLQQPTTTDDWRYFLVTDPVEAIPSKYVWPYRLFLTFPSANSIAAPRIHINGQAATMYQKDGSAIGISALATGKVYKLIYVLDGNTSTYRVINL